MARRRKPRRRGFDGPIEDELRARYERKLISQGVPAEPPTRSYGLYVLADKNLSEGMRETGCGAVFKSWLKYKFNRGSAEFGLRPGDLDVVRRNLDARAAQYGERMQSICRFSRVGADVDAFGPARKLIEARGLVLRRERPPGEGTGPRRLVRVTAPGIYKKG